MPDNSSVYLGAYPMRYKCHIINNKKGYRSVTFRISYKIILTRNPSAISHHPVSPFAATLGSARGYSNNSCECNKRNKQCPFHFFVVFKV